MTMIYCDVDDCKFKSEAGICNREEISINECISLQK